MQTKRNSTLSRPKKSTPAKQPLDFATVAREIGCDDNEPAFTLILKRVAKSIPAKAKKKATGNGRANG